MSSSPGTINGAISSSPEAAFLEEMRQRALRWIGSGAAVAVVGALVLATDLLGGASVVFGIAGVGYGLFLVWLGFAWLRLLPKAHTALIAPPINMRLKANRNMGVWKRSTNAQLWPNDSVTPPPLALFSETLHWAKPRYLTVDKVPAKVFGRPTAGATVVVSCSEGVLAGRIKRSQFDEG
jgi:hypothetical protein